MKTLKDVLTKEQYNQLETLGLLEDIDFVYLSGLINVDMEDFEAVFKNKKLCGYINAKTKDITSIEPIKLLDTKDKAVDGILCIVSDSGLTLNHVNYAINKSKEICEDVNLIYGAYINNDLNGDIVVKGYFTCE